MAANQNPNAAANAVDDAIVNTALTMIENPWPETLYASTVALQAVQSARANASAAALPLDSVKSITARKKARDKKSRRPAGESHSARTVRHRREALRFMATHYLVPNQINILYRYNADGIPNPKIKGKPTSLPDLEDQDQARTDLVFQTRIMNPPMSWDQVRCDPRFAGRTDGTLSSWVSTYTP